MRSPIRGRRPIPARTIMERSVAALSRQQPFAVSGGGYSCGEVDLGGTIRPGRLTIGQTVNHHVNASIGVPWAALVHRAGAAHIWQQITPAMKLARHVEH